MHVAAVPSHVRRTVALLAVLALMVAGLALGTQRPAAAAPVPWEHDIAQDLLSLPTNHSPAPFVYDWNDDGRDDLLVGMRSASLFGGMAVALRQADGSLAPLSSVFASGTISSHPSIGFTLYARPAVADWNGDGAHDLLFGTYYGNEGVVVCLNEGTSASPVIHGAECTPLVDAAGDLVGLTTGSNVAYVSPETVDWDRDGDTDLLVGSGASANEKGVRLYENVGSATTPSLAAPVVVVSRATTPGLAFENYYEPAVVDIDDDGRRDLLIAGSQNSNGDREFALRQCLNIGSDTAPAFSSCSHMWLPGLVNNVVDATDWDGDGYLDLVRGFFSAWIQNPVTLLHGQAPDTDRDGLSDSIDNCVDDPNPPDLMLDKANPVQIDTDGDGLGDVCDADDDGDGVDDTADNCPWTVNADQSDLDGDGRGDVCDAGDGRPNEPGAGSYEARMADLIDWGRKPVITQRADAMSLGYRQEIAEALTDEALGRGLPFTLAVIPWDADRFGAARGSAYLNEVIGDDNLEVAQHGTYHTCVYTPYLEQHGSSAAEFACGMDAAGSYNLMRVGYDALRETVDFDRASHQLTGFIPPTDAYDDAAGEAIQALGYNWVASAWYAEPDMTHIDEQGLVHVPWSQIACGNGAATWTDCGKADLAAHSGVDCDDPDVCQPRREASPKDYSDWDAHAATSLADRCEADFERYGVCSILYELTSYDGDFATGELDPVAFQAYQRTLDELEALADETGAVFMTLGDYAAALRADDQEAPSIQIEADPQYSYTDSFTVDVSVTDGISGVWETGITLDGELVADGDQVDLSELSLGEHELAVTAEDTAGNTSSSSVTFTVVDDVAPAISIHSPSDGTYAHHEVVPVDVDVTDERSSVEDVTLTLDGAPLVDGSSLDLLDLALGSHVLAVTATDSAGNTATESVTFTVEATLASLRSTVERYAAEGEISDAGIVRSLLQKLSAAQASLDRGREVAARNQLSAFVSEVRAQAGKKISATAAEVLAGDAEAVSAEL